jgi:hypothetical protein
MNGIHVVECLQEPFACVALLMEVTSTSPVVSYNVSANDYWFDMYKGGCIQIQACQTMPWWKKSGAVDIAKQCRATAPTSENKTLDRARADASHQTQDFSHLHA